MLKLEPNRLICLKTNYINIGRFGEKSSRGAKTSVLILIKAISGHFGQLASGTMKRWNAWAVERKLRHRGIRPVVRNAFDYGISWPAISAVYKRITVPKDIYDDPDFVSTGSPKGNDDEWATSDDGFMIQSTSPCKDSGYDVTGSYYISDDITGNDRKINGYVDIGAYEYDN